MEINLGDKQTFCLLSQSCFQDSDPVVAFKRPIYCISRYKSRLVCILGSQPSLALLASLQAIKGIYRSASNWVTGDKLYLIFWYAISILAKQRYHGQESVHKTCNTWWLSENKVCNSGILKSKSTGLCHFVLTFLSLQTMKKQKKTRIGLTWFRHRDNVKAFR